MKSGVRLAAFASGPIGADKHAASGRTIIIAVVSKKSEIEGVLSSSIGVNGTDSTRKILGMIETSRFASQIRLVALNGIALAGLNVVDIDALTKRGLNAMVVTRHKPRPSKLIYALRVFSRRNNISIASREQIVKAFAAHKPELVNGMYVQSTLAKEGLVGLASYAADALRLAHLIASGVSRGESKGRI
ncbi:MAG: DUF99 family protein [Candidatus Micrarchaeia archaeon]